MWFGKPLWQRTYNGVVYSLGSIPFGGFVKLPQMAPMDAIEGESEIPRAQLPTASPLDKIIVAVAGPIFSLGLAFVFATIVWQVGRPLSEGEKSTTVGYVAPEGPAAKASSDAGADVVGMQPGDRIIKVDGHPVSRFVGMNGSVVWYVARSEGETIPFEVRRGDRTITFYPKPLGTGESGGSWFRRRPLREVLIIPGFASIVDKVEPGSPAASAGLQKDDVITAVNGRRIYNPQTISDTELAAYNQPIELTIERGGKTLPKTLPGMPFKIGSVTEGGPADKAQLKKGDVVLSVNGVAPGKFSDLRAMFAKHAGEPFKVAFARNGGAPQTVDVTPLVPKDEQDAIIGVGADYEEDGIAWVEGGPTTLDHESPAGQVAGSVTGIVNTIGAIIAPKSGIKLQHLGGPLMIARTYFLLLTSADGWRLALWFSVVLNVNLALLNMLPIPVLDGGHVLLAIIEWIRRKPANIRLLEIIQTACFVVIAGYMLYVSFYDVGDLAGGRKSRRDIEFTTPTPAPGK